MSSLNRVRAIASFNNGKQCFEDLKIDSLGEAVVLDMVNGGGKSFLIQCIGQTIIPNSQWQKDWDFKAVFEPANNNKVVHCLTEWELDEGMGYKYLLAGFCAARPNRTTDSEGESNYGDFERFSYICLYNEHNDNDIFHLPLTEKDIEGNVNRMSLHDLKKYLKDLKKTGVCYTEIPETDRTYKKRLAQYNITNAEWELIRAINADEKYVATYLRSYPTSEKFILKFLIPRIEECNANRRDVEYRGSEELARDLLNIRQLMNELIAKKGQAKEYEKILSFIELIADKLKSIEEKYENRDKVYMEIKKTIAFLERKISSLNSSRLQAEKEIKLEENNLHNNSVKHKALDIYVTEQLLADANKFEKTQSHEVENLDSKVKEETKKLVIKKRENTYLSLLKEKASIAKYIKEKEVLELDNKEVVNERNDLGQKIKNYLAKSIENAKAEKESAGKEKEKIKIEINEQRDINIKAEGELISLKKDLERLSKEEKNLKEDLSSPSFKIIEDTSKDEKSKAEIEKKKEEDLLKKQELKSKASKLQDNITEAAATVSELRLARKDLEQDLKEKDSLLKEGRSMCSRLEECMQRFNAANIENLNNILEFENNKLSAEKVAVSNKIVETNELINNLKRNTLTLSRDTLEVFEIIKERYPDAVLGKDLLASSDTDEKRDFIRSNELIPYAVLLNNSDYKKFISDKSILNNYFGSAVPIIDQDSLSNAVLLPQGVTFTTKDANFFIDADETERIRREKEEELIKLHDREDEIQNDLMELKGNLEVVKSFINKFKSEENLESIAAKVGGLESDLEKNKNDIDEYSNLQVSLRADLLKNTSNITALENAIESYGRQIVELDKYIRINNNYMNVKAEITSIEEEKKVNEKSLADEKNKLEELMRRESSNNDKLLALDKSLDKLEEEDKKIDYVEVNEDEVIEDQEYTKAIGELKAVIDKINGVSSNFKKLEEHIESATGRIEGYMNDIEQDGLSEDELKHITLDFSGNSKGVIDEIQRYVNKLTKELKKESDILEKARTISYSYNEKLKDKIEDLNKNYKVGYDEVKDAVINFINGADPEDKKTELYNLINEGEKKIRELNNNKEKLIIELDKNKDLKTEFTILEKDIDVNILIDNEPLENIRHCNDVKREIVFTKNQIRAQKEDYLSKIKDGESLAKYMSGFNDILESLKELPRTIDSIDELICTLIGEEDDAEESVLSLVKQEQVTLDENIKSLELQEDKFITLCIQQSENILRDIKKLADLSSIDINGMKQDMIKVNLSKLDDDIAKERMKNYIENLINSSIVLTDDNERRLELAKGLKIEKLFQQIIKPIKASSIQLYKLEDINNMELNTWLTWDRAYGSKGQTNGMYISVLICLISYLRKLYTTSRDNSKKVIILDNPFSGTTSEIIWLPILKLLEENNVQLWAFGYEIKTQLANCFNVRYLLEKKPGKGHENIIVSSFRSNTDIENLGYDPLTGKKIEILQESLL